MKLHASARTLLTSVLLVSAAFLTAASDNDASKAVPTEPWLILLNEPDKRIIGYMRDDLASVPYVRKVGQEVCARVNDEFCAVWFWSDYELALKVIEVSNWTEEMMENRLARFRRHDLAESVMIYCPEETIVIVGGKSFCRPETGYWPLFPSDDE